MSNKKKRETQRTAVEKVMDTAKELLAKIPGRKKKPTLAMQAKEFREKNAKAAAKAPTLKGALTGDSQGAKVTSLKARAVTGRKGAIAQPPLDDIGARHH